MDQRGLGISVPWFLIFIFRLESAASCQRRHLVPLTLLVDTHRGVKFLISVIDYKAGNLTSVVKALRFLGAKDVVVTQSPGEVLRADKIVLPGVGHFQSTQLLEGLGLTQAVREAVAKGTPFLGICVGLQWLYEGSTEAAETAGLGEFGGRCERFPALYEGAELKSPHVGWNSLEEVRGDSRLLRGVEAGSFVYFTHSWRAPVSEDTAAQTMYGGAFTAAVERGNVMGVQFHPEKSAETGLKVLRNFLEL
jgi:glutamine amidotransferase